MSFTDWLVLLGSVAFLAFFYWWFFLSAGTEAVAVEAAPSGLQEVEIVVKGGYRPEHITVKAGQPVRLLFRREEDSACSEEVKIPDFRVSRALPAYATTPVEFTPQTPGTYDFTCGMGMMHGTITVT